MKIMNEYEENYTLLRDLNEGTQFISKSNSVCIYLKSLDNDKHSIYSFESNKSFEVPHGNFPIFKKL